MTDQVPDAARQLAAELADVFETDRGLAEQQNSAQHRLQAANDRLWSGLHPDALGLVYDGAAAGGAGQGSSQVAGAIVDAVRSGGSEAEVHVRGPGLILTPPAATSAATKEAISSPISAAKWRRSSPRCWCSEKAR